MLRTFIIGMILLAIFMCGLAIVITYLDQIEYTWFQNSTPEYHKCSYQDFVDNKECIITCVKINSTFISTERNFTNSNHCICYKNGEIIKV